MRVFVAGANGAIGRRLVPMLVARGHDVTGTTTSEKSVESIRKLGAEPVVVDGLENLHSPVPTKHHADMGVFRPRGFCDGHALRRYCASRLAL